MKGQRITSEKAATKVGQRIADINVKSVHLLSTGFGNT